MARDSNKSAGFILFETWSMPKMQPGNAASLRIIWIVIVILFLLLKSCSSYF